MPDQNKPAQLMPYEKAAEHVATNVYTAVFFEKLASLGITPSTQAEAEQLLQMGELVRAHEQQHGQAKVASDNSQALANLNAQLANSLGLQFDNGSTKRAAALFANDPATYNAVLSLRAHEAQAALASQPQA